MVENSKQEIMVPGISNFRLCTLDDDRLLYKLTSAMFDMYNSGKIPTRHIPARPDSDFDLMFGELVHRFKEYKDRAEWADSYIRKSLDSTGDSDH